MNAGKLKYFIFLLLASCAGQETERYIGAFFDSLRQDLEVNGNLSKQSIQNIAVLDSLSPNFSEWEKHEMHQHIIACRSERYSNEEKQANIESLLAYKAKLKKYYIGRKDSLQRLHLKSIFETISDPNVWDSAFVEDYYWGSSSYMVVLLPQVHEVNNTEQELAIVRPVQQNIFSIQKKLFNYGANVFLYEGIPFKEIAREIPTKIPLDTIAKYYSKKSEIDFETNHPQVLSYGVENKAIHNKADSIRSYYWALETFYKSNGDHFPIESKMFQQSMQKHVDSCMNVNDVNLKRLNKYYLDSIIARRLIKDNVVYSEEFLEIKNQIFNELLEVMLNERNLTFVLNTEKLQKQTGERFLVMKAGTSHFDEVDLIKEYDDFNLLTIQDILRDKGISYVYLVPYYVYHFNL